MNRKHLFALILFGALSVVLTWPLAVQFSDHVPGTSTWSLDEYGYVWNTWWLRYAVFDKGVNPFFTNYLFYPVGTSLVLYAYTLLHVLLALPIQFAFGLIPAVNSTVLFSFAIAAFGMNLFLFYLLRTSLRIWKDRFGDNIQSAGSGDQLIALASIIGGIAFAFTSNRFVYVSLGHYNIVATEWLPFYLLFLFKTMLNADIKNPLFAGLFGAFALYTETTDGVLIALLTLVVIVFEWRLLNRSTLKRLAIVMGTSLVLFSPLLLPTLAEIFASGYSLPGWGHSEKLLVDLAGFLTPTSLHPLDRHWLTELDLVRQGISRFSDVNTLFLGYVTVALAIFGFFLFRRRTRIWLAIALIFGILSLGPLLHINGVSEFDLDGLTTTVPLPFLILHYIPLLRENRVPNRYGILVTLALAVLVAYATWWILNKIAVRTSGFARPAVPVIIAILLGAALLFEHLAVPIPLTDARPPDIYSQLARIPGDFTVLSLPIGWRNSFGQLGAEDTRTQYYQAVSRKFLLSGNIQRNPPFIFDYFQRAPILSSIIALETYNDVDSATVERDRKLAPSFVNFFDIRYLVVNPSVPNRPPYSDTRDRVLQYIKQVFPIGEQVSDRDGVLAFKVNAHPGNLPTTVDFGTADAYLYEGEGFSADQMIAGATGNWATGQNARVFFPLSAPSDCSVTVRALPYDYPGQEQTITLVANGSRIGTSTLKSGWGEYTFQLPANQLHAGLNELTWQFAYLVRPRDVVPPQFAIGTTGVSSPVDIEAQSTAQFGSIKVAGREVSPLKRGYNLAVVDQKTGGLLSVATFDTGGTSGTESRSMADFLSKLPSGVIVMGATQEEAATSLGPRAVAAIEALGLNTDLRGTNGHTHAFIAVKGHPGGLEQTGDGSSLVSVGHSLDERMLAAAFDWLRVTLR